MRARRLSEDEQLALAWGQLPGLLALGAGLGEAVRRSAEGLPEGRTRGELMRAAAAIDDGRPAGAALAATLPEGLAPVLAEGDDALPERIALLADFYRSRLTRSAETRAASRYPLAMSGGAVVIVAILALLRLAAAPLAEGADGRSAAFALGLAVLAALALATSVRALRRGRTPSWARALPGSDCADLRAAESFSANLALLLESGAVRGGSEVDAALASAAWLPGARERARRGASLGARELPLGQFLANLRLPDEARFEIVLGQSMGDTAAGARHAAARLAKLARARERQFAASVGVALLCFAGLCLLFGTPGTLVIELWAALL